MAYQAVDFLWPSYIMTGSQGAHGYSNTLIDADGEAYGFSFVSPVTDTITKIGFVTRTVTTGGDLDCRVETLDANYLPSGTLWNTTTNILVAVASGDDNVYKEGTLTSAASVTAGDYVGIVVTRPTSGAFNGNLGYIGNHNGSGFPAHQAKTASWVNNSDRINTITVHFSSGGYVRIDRMLAPSACTVVSVATNLTPDIMGNSFTPTVNMKVKGIAAMLDADATGTLSIIDSDGATVLASVSVPATIGGGSTGYQLVVYPITEVTLSAGEEYRVCYESTTTTSVSMTELQFSSSGIRGQSIFGDFQKTTAKDPNDPTDWTDTDTTVLPFFLKVSAVDDGSGGGGGGGETSSTFC